MSPVRLIPGMVIKPVSDQSVIKEPQRVLSLDEALNSVVLIPVQPARYRSRLFFRGYKTNSLSEVKKQLAMEEPYLQVVNVAPRAITLLDERQLDTKYLRRSQTQSSALRLLNERWKLIEPLVCSENATQLLNRKFLIEAVKAHAKLHSKGEKESDKKYHRIMEYLNQYWAGGSIRSALIPFRNQCGGQGKPRKRTDVKLGRPNVLTKSGLKNLEGYICSEKDIGVIQFCWRNFVLRDVSVAKAYRRMGREFYSRLKIQDNGTTVEDLLPSNQRPTLAEFRYWGAKQKQNEEAWKRQLPPNGYQRNWRALSGSANDDVVAVGQRAAVDSTPPDLHFVSILSRLNRIGGAYRIIIVDSLFDYIPGFYLGLDAPSSKTVKLAFLHAMSDKTQWLADLGLDLPVEDWIPLSFTQAIADNTDLRSEEVKYALNSIGTNLMFVPKRRSDLNPLAEGGHHMLHRLVDHNLNGSTHGRRNERGEVPADTRARHTILEAIRETARAVHFHNTEELDIFKTLAMREAGVRPSRVAMTQWSINSGKIARTTLDIATARMKLLPTCRGCFTESGVKLLRPDSGNKRIFINPLRYVSEHHFILKQMELARRGGKHKMNFFDADFRYDPFNIRQIYFFDADNYGLITLDLKINDPDLPNRASMDDVIDIQDQDNVDKFFIAEQRESSRSRMESAQDETNKESEKAYQQEISRLTKTPSKAKLTANKKENRMHEETILRDGMPILLNSSDLETTHNNSNEPIHSPSNNTPLVSSDSTSVEKNSLLAQVINRRREKNNE